jgi:putative FmdB family regulatory protein
MAIYEYECKKCNHRFETLTKKPTNKPETCPECGDVAPKVVSKSTFILGDKGKVGWADKGYSTK